MKTRVPRRFWLLAVVLFTTTAVVAAWAVTTRPALRADVVEVAGRHGVTPLVERGLADSDARVRLRACRTMAIPSHPKTDDLLRALLADPDPKVVDCALMAMARRPADALLIDAATARWYRLLMTVLDDEGDGREACRLADHVRRAERLGATSAPRLLFQCALDAPSTPARECCAQSLRAVAGHAEASVPMLLPSPARLAETAFVEHVPTMVRAAFAIAPGHGRLQFDRADRAWALAVGCETLSTGGAVRRAEVSTPIAKAISGRGCHVEPATELTVRIWQASCSDVLTPEALVAPDASEPGRLCTRIRDGITADTLNEARYGVQLAIRHARHPDRAAVMMRQLLEYPEKDDVDPSRRPAFSLREVARRVQREHPGQTIGKQDVLEVMSQMAKERNESGKRAWPTVPVSVPE